MRLLRAWYQILNRLVSCLLVSYEDLNSARLKNFDCALDLKIY